MEYIGEHPLPGQIGHAFTVIAFVASLFASVSYFLSVRLRSEADIRRYTLYGRIGFLTHVFAIIGLSATLLYMFANQYIEYEYVYSHTNSQMPAKYIIVAFWGGQQGSLILWSFWNAILGSLLVWWGRNWERPVLSIIALIQVFVTSTLLGVYVFDMKFGESPFTLYRDTPNAVAYYWTHIHDYLRADDFFEDGSGLNLTLQNYWMVIHPPVLFLGFSSVMIPFSFAVAGLWKRDYTGWIQPALPWTFFSMAALGAGILLGGAWAYESLNFGGFWAWDPVENASLVPWLVLVAASHIMLISKTKKKPLYAAFLFPVIAFFLVLYSTFLTRSGILGDSSVHSFTGDGMLNQLLFFMIVFLWLPFYALILHGRTRLYFTIFAAALFLLGVFADYDAVLISSGNFKIGWRGVLFVLGISGCIFFMNRGYYRGFPMEKKSKPDALLSREFWMFTGGLLLLLSAVHIILSTSMPVINDILGTAFAPVAAEERNKYYAEYQVPFAVVISFLMAGAMMLRWKSGAAGIWLRRMMIPMVSGAAITWLLADIYGFEQKQWWLILLMFTSSTMLVSNLQYWIQYAKGNMKGVGAALSHTGFALLILGTVISQAQQVVISMNRDGRDIRFVSKEFNEFTEAQVYYGDTALIGNYFISYNKKYSEGNKIFYGMEFFTPERSVYVTGDTVRFASGLAVALADHSAGSEFSEDMRQGLWKPVFDSSRLFYSFKQWQPMLPGKSEFVLTPHVQLDAQGKAGSNEPGTMHFWHRDVFIYLRDAKLSDDGDYHQEPLTSDREFKLMDTVRIPHYFLIPDSIFAVTDSSRKEELRLMQIDSVMAVRFKIHPLFYDNLMSQYSYGYGLFILRDTIQIPDMQQESVFQLRIGLRDMKIPRDSAGFNINNAVFKVSVQDRESIVFKAIEFPMIGLLWIGCVVMTLGTLMSVVSHVKSRKKKSKG